MSSSLTRPAPLLPGARVAVLAISSPSQPDRILKARDHLESRGLTVTLAGNLFANPGDGTPSYLAGSDALRLAEINRFLRGQEWDGFLFARGGYGAMRILEGIDYDAIRRNPRPIIGFSDLTALHQAIARRAEVGTFHGPMLNTDFYEKLSPGIDRWFWGMLAGEPRMTHRFSPLQVVSGGRAEGVVFGGCLSLTAALIGTPFDYWVPDGIWFWEEVSEPTYRIDRMLTHLRLSGRFRDLRGVMIGKLKECGGDAPGELDSFLSGFFGSAGIPVIRDLPFGHFGDNLLMPVGALAKLDSDSCTLEFPEPVVSPRGK